MPFFLKRWRGTHNDRVDRIARGVFRFLLALAVVLSLASCVYATLYAWIQAKLYSYGKNDWQMCLTWGGSADQSFPGSAATVGIKSIVFLVMATFVAHLGIKDHNMLPYALFMGFIGMLGVLVYRESSPVQPVPRQMSASLLTLAKYVQPGMYDMVCPVPLLTPAQCTYPTAEVCKAAYGFNKGFVSLQFAMFALTVALFVLVLYIIAASPKDYLTVDLVGHRTCLFLVAVTLTGYVCTLIAKEIVAVSSLTVSETIYNGLAAAQFIFKRADMDIMSVTMLVSCGATLMGTYHECVKKFRLAAFTAFLHTVISVPVVLSTFAGYYDYTYPLKGRTYNLWKKEECHAYLKSQYPGRLPGQSLFDAYPEELDSICRQLPVSLIGQVIVFGAMVLHIFASLHVMWANSKFQRPPDETRCMSCAYRIEDAGYFTVEHQPTMVGPLDSSMVMSAPGDASSWVAADELARSRAGTADSRASSNVPLRTSLHVPLLEEHDEQADSV